jgi:hypothetical protein
MSQENVEIVRKLYRAGDPSRFFELLDDDVEFDFSAYPVPSSPELRGKEAAIEWSRSWWGTWDDYVLVPPRSSMPAKAVSSSSSTSGDAEKVAGRSLTAAGRSSTPSERAR